MISQSIILIRRFGTFGVLAMMTAASIIMSVGLVCLVMIAGFGFDFSKPLSSGAMWGLAIGFSTLIPLLVAPLVGASMVKLVVQLDRLSTELERMAETDQLTRLLNRRGFEQQSRKILRQEQGATASAALFMCDIDHFKSINDKFGHEFGDASLKVAAEALRETLERHGAIVARHGGEEFVALIPGLSEREALCVAEDVRRLCESKVVSLDEKQSRFTMSVGVALSSAALRDVAQMMREADVALYRAKREGRNRVVIAA